MTIDHIIKERDILNKKIEQIGQILANASSDYLICRKRSDGYYYSCRPRRNSDGKYQEIYLRKGDPLITELAKRDYYMQYRKDLINERDAIDSYLRKHQEETEVSRFLEKHPGVREILQPALMDPKNKYMEWACADYPRNRLHPEHLIYITEGGFYVRSKAEQMISNMFLAEGIPFRYEDPVVLQDGTVIHPDFHIYSLRDYREWYLEHNGQMRKDTYYNNYEIKLRQLRKAGIIPGVNLLQTFEADGFPLDPGCVRDLINRYLK